jgi:hypothetical protein
MMIIIINNFNNLIYNFMIDIIINLLMKQYIIIIMIIHLHFIHFNIFINLLFILTN